MWRRSRKLGSYRTSIAVSIYLYKEGLQRFHEGKGRGYCVGSISPETQNPECLSVGLSVSMCACLFACMYLCLYVRTRTVSQCTSLAYLHTSSHADTRRSVPVIRHARRQGLARFRAKSPPYKSNHISSEQEAGQRIPKPLPRL